MSSAVPNWLGSGANGEQLSPESRGEILTRLHSDQLTQKDLHWLLFEQSLAGIKRLHPFIFEYLQENPHQVPGVFSVHSQLTGSPRPDTTPSPVLIDGNIAFSGKATLLVKGKVLEGECHTASSKKAVVHLSLLSLLRRLVDGHTVSNTAMPTRPSPPEAPASLQTAQPELSAPSPSNDSSSYALLDERTFLAVVGSAVTEGGASSDLLRHTLLRARSGVLTDKQFAQVLFGTRSPEWDEIKRAGLRAAAAQPPMLAWLLNRYAAIASTATAEFTDKFCDDGYKESWLTIPGHDSDKTFGPSRHISKSGARQGVRLEALGQLSGIGSPGSWPANDAQPLLVVTGSQTPLDTLSGATKRGVTKLSWSEFRTEGGRQGARLTCRWHDATLTADGTGALRKHARQAAAVTMILKINSLHEQSQQATVTPQADDHPGEQVSDEPSTPRTPAPALTSSPTLSSEKAHSCRTAGRSGAGRQCGSRKAFAAALSRGDHLAFDTSVRAPLAGLMWFSHPSARTGLPGATGERLLIDRDGNQWPVNGWNVATTDAIAVLSQPAEAAWTKPARLWKRVVELSLSLIAQGRVHPALDLTEDRRARLATWRIGPLQPNESSEVAAIAAELGEFPHVCVDLLQQEIPPRESADLVRAVRSMMDLIAAAMVMTRSREYLHGSLPCATESYVDDPASITAIQRWIDDFPLQSALSAGPAEGPIYLRLDIRPPEPNSTVFEGSLLFSRLPDSADSAIDAETVWANQLLGHDVLTVPEFQDHVRRILRLAGRVVPALESLGAERYPSCFWLTGEEAAALSGSAVQPLRDLGIEVQWHKDWATRLTAEVVVEPETSCAPLTGRLGLGELFDRRWRIKADGQVLSAIELDALRKSALPWVMQRNRWILIDDLTEGPLRRPKLEKVPRARALLSVLDGWMEIEGKTFACSPAAGIAALIGRLRSTDFTQAIAKVSAETHLPLMPHQTEAVAWIRCMAEAGFGSLLADDMGLGKTITGLAYHLLRDRPGATRPTLVICPNEGVLDQWRKEIETYSPDERWEIYWDKDRSLNECAAASIVLTTYGVVKSSQKELTGISWGLVVADEAQRVKNISTEAAKSVRALPATTRVALSGTPMENRPGELWAILDWCNPGLFGDRTQFHTFAVRPILDADGEQELQRARVRAQRIVRPFVQRRLKSDPRLKLDLPDKYETTHLFELSDRQRGLLEALENVNRRKLDTHDMAALRGLTKRVTHKQRMITNSPAHYLDNSLDIVEGGQGELERDSPKLPKLRQLVTALSQTGERALIFTNYVYPAKLIHGYLGVHGLNTGLYIGRVGHSARKELVDELNHGDVQVLIATVTTAGVGLDLTRANHVIHFERHWNPAIEAQATDRVHRIGQIRPVHVHYFTTRNSIEERIAALLNEKRDQSDLFMPKGDIDFSQLTADQLVRLANLTRP